MLSPFEIAEAFGLCYVGKETSPESGEGDYAFDFHGKPYHVWYWQANNVEEAKDFAGRFILNAIGQHCSEEFAFFR